MSLRESLGKYLSEEEIVSLLDSMEKERTHALLLNTNKMDDEEFLRRYPNVRKHPFVPHAYLYDKDEYEFGKDIFYDCGVYSIQDPSAMMVPFFLSPKPGE
ncbi:MAG: RNA methyltransferase, partial [Bacilli bacterium]|nr:RNA methyltransferase [Bacilli bacterium]